ncbi:hypothetical protein DICPUDRAFT_47703 [Dictyostelium purpureum]|uniref:Ras guanine nucleotide exchange factor glfB-like C-terminal domain-containing protein n=1 Tax=Dictyostelium purpureum TaxID=5786 RepID=F0ZKT2_DICPU|nr:uncharacterized protein DICPUDRAFT_47703 [Dictyostelium purpureum]EGC35413.1 hypothetical protein DICPUDRAFT_47703 [Dictyostelium purpureum]|eukprot:XP_003288026.1 hypothetical protein DICPUDRAFT_47703 [Dictyostelium purpureum]
MGSCASKPKKANNSTKNKKRLSSNISKSNNQDISSADAKKFQDEHKNNLNQVALNWKPNTIGIWKRSHEKLAIHTDIPRLGHKIEIIDKLDRLSNISFSNVTSISLNNNTIPSSENLDALQQQSQQQSQQDNNNNNTSTTTQQNENITPKSEQLLEHNSKYTSLTTLTSHGFSTAQVLKKEEVVYQVLTNLAHLLDGEEKEKRIKNNFSNYIKGSGDMSQQLLALLGAEVGENSRLMSLLKVCHQKIILPSYYFIKANLFEDLPFRDKRGSWRMRITFETDGTVVASHSKRQQSTGGAENDPEFEFEWCLSIIFDKEMMITALRVEVTDLIISKNISDDKKQEIQRAFSILQSATNSTNSNNSSEPIPLNKVEF